MAKLLYCWRCQTEMPMLEEYEWKEIYPLLKDWTERGQAARARYKEFTGLDELNPAAIWHHRLSLYGPHAWQIWQNYASRWQINSSIRMVRVLGTLGGADLFSVHGLELGFHSSFWHFSNMPRCLTLAASLDPFG
jgi:hypothetical protein